MGKFILRLFIFASLWLLLFLQLVATPTVQTYVICTVIFSFYFFIPISKKQLTLYFLMISLLFIQFAFIVPNMNAYAILIILYLITEAVFILSPKKFASLLIYTVIGTMTSHFFMSPLDIKELFFFCFYCFLAIASNQLNAERSTHKDMYQQLLIEYRRLKRSVFDSEKAVRWEERTKIARDIHDSVGHKLTALLLKLEILSIEKGKEYFQDLKQLVNDSLEETRLAVRTLKTDEQEGISSVIHLIRKLEAESNIVVHFTIKQGMLSSNLSNVENIVLYRVIQEALTNAMRHGTSREIGVHIGRNAIGEVEIMVKNKVHTEKTVQFGFGLSNMKERLEEIGGKLVTGYQQGQFVIRANFPQKERKGNVETINS